MQATYDTMQTMREARRQYFEVNRFGADGGYGDAWVNFKIGPFPLPFPNTASRVKAVRYHDLNHLVTGYDTDVAGEFEISAWEVASGCRDFGAAWVLNLSGMTGGLVSTPRRTFRAFVRGRRSTAIYGEAFEPLLDTTVGELRKKQLAPDDAGPGAALSATAVDALLFAVSVTTGLVIGLTLLALFLPLVPVGIAWMAIARRRGITAKAM